MTTTQITTQQLTSVLNGLFGCEIAASQIENPKPIEDPRVVAAYNDMEGQLRFAITCDLSVANSLGAALTMIPPGGAEDATVEGSVPANIGDNLYEVLNICSTVFADIEHHRIVLSKVHLPGQQIPAELTETVASAETMLQIQYELAHYPSGRISMLRINP